MLCHLARGSDPRFDPSAIQDGPRESWIECVQTPWTGSGAVPMEWRRQIRSVTPTAGCLGTVVEWEGEAPAEPGVRNRHLYDSPGGSPSIGPRPTYHAIRQIGGDFQESIAARTSFHTRSFTMNLSAEIPLSYYYINSYGGLSRVNSASPTIDNSVLSK